MNKTETTLNLKETFWKVVEIKDQIDSVSWSMVDDRNIPYERMSKVDLHNAKVELNKVLEKLYLLMEADKS